MEAIFIISSLMLLIGLFLFIKKKNSFFTGIIVITSIMGLIYCFTIAFALSNKYVGIVIIIAVFLLLFIGVPTGAIFLVLNTKKMTSKEGVKLVSFLSSIIVLYIIINIFFSYILILFGNKLNTYVRVMMLIVLLISIYLGFIFLCYLLYSYMYQKISFIKKVDYIIVLGSGLIGDRVPPLLKSRLDKGIEIYKKQVEQGYKSKIIVSGGKGYDELVSEAYAMRKYLISQKIDNEDIVMEDKSTTTYENMKFSKALMGEFQNYSCVFVTNNYHVFRAAIYAGKVGLKISGVGSHTAFYFLPSALIREFIAILVLNKKINIVIITLIVIFVIIASIL